MSSAQDRLVTISALLAESAWISALLGMIGLMLGGQGSPLGWLAVFAIMSSSLFVSRGLQMIVMPVLTARVLQMLAGVLVVYLAVGSQVTPGLGGFDLGWLGNLNGNEPTGGYTFRGVLGSIFGVILWLRGGTLGSSDSLTDSLGASFKIGLIALAIAAVVDIFHSADLNVYAMMFLFFGASMVGMGVGHVLPGTARIVDNSTWPKVIGGVASTVVVIGLLFSLLQKNTLTWISTPIGFILNGIMMIIFYVIVVPIVFVVDLITSFIFGLLLYFFEGPPPEQTTLLGDLTGQLEALRNQRGDEPPFGEAVLQVLAWVVLGLIVVIALIILARAFQRRYKWRKKEDEAIHESVGEDADPLKDLGNLLFNLIPSRLRRKSTQKRLLLPDDEVNVVDVFRIYFGMLMIAQEKGFPRPSSETPYEYQRTLEQAFTPAIVRPATHAFVRACYGHIPTTREQIEEMQAVLEQVASEK